MSYFIKRPGSGRKSFALVGPDGKTILDTRIARVNEDLAKGLAIDLLEERMQLILREYQGDRNRPVQTAFGNIELANSVQAWKVSRRPLRDPYASMAALRRAVEHVGLLSLYTVSEKELLEAVNREPDLFKREYLKRDLNQMLRFIKRDFTLKVTKLKKATVVKFLPFESFIPKAEKVNDETDRLYLRCLFATGCRYGELPCIHLLETGVVVQYQITRKGEWSVTKNGKQREAPVIPELLPDVKKWLEIEEERRIKIRLERESKMRKACQKEIGLTLHDLRHCYAIRWRQHGFTPGQIAEFIGDTEEVCREHYLRFGGDSDAVKLAVRQYEAAQKLKKA